ncbi:hypothetical protein [Glutamicibacter sp. NPDC087344]|uniref:hypothetical protein n=1 Tax=Glutamicibacter sp. NPDC087344 TaxID=3363994 RepID=UPI003822B47E
MSLRRRRTGRNRDPRRSKRDTLPRRRAAAVALALALPLLAVGISSEAETSFAYDAHLVATESSASARLVEISGCHRGCSNYVLSKGGEEFPLDRYDALDDPQVGDEVDYVVDPQDPGRAVAVGYPEFWESDPDGNLLLRLVLMAMALGAAAWSAAKLVPEDLKRLTTKTQAPPGTSDSWGA